MNETLTLSRRSASYAAGENPSLSAVPKIFSLSVSTAIESTQGGARLSAKPQMVEWGFPYALIMFSLFGCRSNPLMESRSRKGSSERRQGRRTGEHRQMRKLAPRIVCQPPRMVICRRRKQIEIQAPFDFKGVCGAWFKSSGPSEERKS